jgi:transposase-like protein
MARAFSGDLRCPILPAYERGGESLAELARQFGVGRDLWSPAISNLLLRHTATL